MKKRFLVVLVFAMLLSTMIIGCERKETFEYVNFTYQVINLPEEENEIDLENIMETFDEAINMGRTELYIEYLYESEGKSTSEEYTKYKEIKKKWEKDKTEENLKYLQEIIQQLSGERYDLGENIEKQTLDSIDDAIKLGRSEMYIEYLYDDNKYKLEEEYSTYKKAKRNWEEEKGKRTLEALMHTVNVILEKIN